MGILLTILHVIVAVFLILVVLLQTGKRADLAGAFGGGGSQTAFGSRGAATVLSKATTAAAVLFMLTSIGLSIVSSTGAVRSSSVLGDVSEPVSSSDAPSSIPDATDPLPSSGDVAPPEQGALSADEPEDVLGDAEQP